MQQEKVRAHSEDIENDEPSRQQGHCTAQTPEKAPTFFFGRCGGIVAPLRRMGQGLLDLISNQVAFTTSKRHKGFQEEPKRSID
jgi:hypothetical protein